MQSKTRLDKLLVKQGHCRSRNQASELISLGLVEVKFGLQWAAVYKASATFSTATQVRIADNQLQKYVSRAALKLLGAIQKTAVKVTDLRVLDIGQSTGGFTQILLEQGAAQVVGIEVGRGQLAQPLQDHPQVICLEGANARDLTRVLRASAPGCDKRTDQPVAADNLQPFAFAVMDVSFISQTLILPELRKVLATDAGMLSLVKPQFETGPAGLAKGGIVRSAKLLDQVRDNIVHCCTANDFKVRDYFPSQITGSDGNQEFFVYATAT